MSTTPAHSAVRSHPKWRASAALAGFFLSTLTLPGQLLSNLQSFPDRIPVGDPLSTADDRKEGPKGIASADFNGDGKPDLAAGNLDGTITVLFGHGSGNFLPPRHIRTGAHELRSVLAEDLDGNGSPDLAAASPMDGKLLIYFNPGSGNFSAATPLTGWIGVRSLAAGDFDGDGIVDLAAAGPGLGVRHFQGTGGGMFEIMGDLPRLSPQSPELPRPVYAMRTLRSRDGLRDELLVTHADSPALWILSTVPANRASEPPANLAMLPRWSNLPSPVLLHEVQIQNATTLRDADGTTQPWVELINKSAAAVNLAGWHLQSDTVAWTFPAVTIEPGRMLIVFLSGKNRAKGPELHASILLQQNSNSLTLRQPNGTEANQFILTPHNLADVSYGLAPDLDAHRYFDLPSPGAENNAGWTSVDDLRQDSLTTLTITPRNPGPAQSTTVRVTMPESPTGSSSVRNVWFSATPGLHEVHHLLHRVSRGVYEEVLPPGAFTGNTAHRVLARLRDGTSNDYTTEVHRGLDEPLLTQVTAPRPGSLRPIASVPSPKVKSFETGAVRSPAGKAGAAADLVYADDVCGLLRVHRAGPGARRFEPLPVQDVPVRGAPRDVKLADTNDDGWLDATVILRELDLALSFKNENGVLRATGELPTGRSPREAVMADFTGDGKPDAAVINRYSADISILPSASNLPGLVSLDQIYPVNGEVAGLLVKDFNGDGRDDVMQLHRASGEVSTRLAGPDGTLGPPVFNSTSSLTGPSGTTGQSPSGFAVADVNNDGRVDALTANLGFGGSGSISVLIAKPDGTYEPARNVSSGGAMFAISVADFDGDTFQDVVAGLFDCRVAFFRGDGTGNFTSTYTVPFAYESRVMVTGDFDQDGDIDISGAGYAGDMVTLENRGAATASQWFKRSYPAGSGAHGTERIGLFFVNADADPDLVIGTGSGIVVYTGHTGMEFQVAPEYSGGVGFTVSDVLTSDLDGDGTLEMVVACRNASCINILTQNASGQFAPVTQADVPSGRYIASGDLDDDGKADLVGTGDVLWTVLSSRPPQTAAPGSTETNRPQTSQVVINEVLSQNTGVPITADSGRQTDFVEIFNGASSPAVLTGWKVRLQSIQEGTPIDQSWTLPATTALGRGHAIILFSADPGPTHTGFTMPAEGGTVTLLRPDNSEADRVEYPPAQENVSWSRYLDGHPSFRADRIPSPGMSNLDNGTVPPEVKLAAPSPLTMVAGQALTFTARGRDDAGIISLSLLWNRLDAPFPETQRVVLYDDGMHQDAGPVDGFFSGQLNPGLPAGTEVQFYLEAVDISGAVLILPDSAELVASGDIPVAWSFSLTTPPPLEIAEVSTNNVSGRRDDLGGHADYVTVRNTGAAPVDLSGILLAKSPLSAASSVFAFPSGLVLAPGAETTVFADDNTSQGALHAPFTLDAGGDDLSLLAVTPSGARQWIHSLNVPASPADSSFRRLPGTDLRAVIATAADMTNWSGMAVDAGGGSVAVAHFTALAGYTYHIEGDASGAPVAWSLLELVTGDGAVHTITRPVAEMSALRVTPVAAAPTIRIDDVMVTASGATVWGEAPRASLVTVFFGLTDGSIAPNTWANSRTGTSAMAIDSAELNSNTTYYYRVRADNAAGMAWSPPGTSFTTRPFPTVAPQSLTLAELNPTRARVNITFSAAVPAGSSVALLAGTTDRFSNVAAWQRSVPATPIPTPAHTWSADLPGLTRNTNYFARALLTTASGQTIARQRLTFQTPDAEANLAVNLRLSEIMYNPSAPTAAEIAAGYERDDFEFIELHNASNESMDLSGLWFEAGLEFDFPATGAPMVPPGGYAVIAANPHAFAMRYGANIPLAGWTLHPFRRARLANGGEFITLRAADGADLFSVFYNDRPEHWSDGYGYSLEFRGPFSPAAAESSGDYAASRTTNGTPGQPRLPAPDLTYDQWKALRFTAAEAGNPLISGPNGDPDRDGLTNLLEYSCGTRPKVPESNGLVSMTDGGFFGSVPVTSLTFPVNVRAAAVQLYVQRSPDLSEWGESRGYFNSSGWNSAGVWGSYPTSSVLSSDGSQLMVTIALPHPSAESRSFYRLMPIPGP